MTDPTCLTDRQREVSCAAPTRQGKGDLSKMMLVALHALSDANVLHNLKGYGEPRSAIVHSVRARSNAATACIGRTHERPAAEQPTAQPTQRWCSDCGKVRANVTGKSARTVRLHPSWALGLHCTEAACRWRRRTSPGHPAAAMGATQ